MRSFSLTLICMMSWQLFYLLPGRASAAEHKDLFNFNQGRSNDCYMCSEMVTVPDGTYLMGATAEEFQGSDKYQNLYIDEIPRHQERVKAFKLAKFDVTKKQFAIFASETGFQGKGCRVFRDHQWVVDPTADWANPGFKQSDDDPVVCVSWNDANKFVAWLNAKMPKTLGIEYRLPSEVEWEYAARAGTVTATYWGNNAADQCRYENARDIAAKDLDASVPIANCNDGFIETSPVGTFKANPWGLFDMLGDVSQWMENCPQIGYPGKDSIPCRGKALRGASWAGIPIAVRAASRGGEPVDTRSSCYGFRLAANADSNK
jgi:formylglycine-generating enzyme required for sulfatase activity